jgi:hypothetical protein
VRRRQETNIPVSTRKAVEGLPRPFYDDKWISEKSRAEKQMEISAQKFPWMNIVAGDGKD